MIWYGFANKGNPVACEDMFEGQFEGLLAHSGKEENRNRYYLPERQVRGRHKAAVEKFLFERAKAERKENAIERLFRAVEERLYREGNGRDPDLRDALNEAIAEYERATVRGIAVEPIVKRGGE
jgi:hypothetical protein